MGVYVGSNGEPVFCEVYGHTIDYYEEHHLPTKRPLAEPPMFDYDDIIENRLPSDTRVSKLFPNDIERWTRCRDLETEHLLLRDYMAWIRGMKRCEKDPAGRNFYKGLFWELEKIGDKFLKKQLSRYESVETLAG